jgi:hypothetical protein
VLIGVLFTGIPSEVAVCLLAYSSLVCLPKLQCAYWRTLHWYPFRSFSVLIGVLFIGMPSEVAVCLLTYSLNWVPFRSCSVDVLSRLGPLPKFQCAYWHTVHWYPFRSCSVLIDVLSQLGPLPKLQCGRTLSTGPPCEVAVCLLTYP